jgi:RNA polymerase primary sigma factor
MRIRTEGRRTTKVNGSRGSKTRTAVAPSRIEFDAPEAKAPVQPEPVQPVEGHVTNGDSLQLYLREIGQVKLLTPAEEIVLAKRIKRGDKSAREHMIKANLRLVVKIARDYENLGLPLLDLINEGNIGLMKGVERFDPKKGAKLSTYASWWIKQAIKRALANQSKTIRRCTWWTKSRTFAARKCDCAKCLIASRRMKRSRANSAWTRNA